MAAPGCAQKIPLGKESWDSVDVGNGECRSLKDGLALVGGSELFVTRELVKERKDGETNGRPVG